MDCLELSDNGLTIDFEELEALQEEVMQYCVEKRTSDDGGQIIDVTPDIIDSKIISGPHTATLRCAVCGVRSPCPILRVFSGL
jgi:hypothetical protein